MGTRTQLRVKSPFVSIWAGFILSEPKNKNELGLVLKSCRDHAIALHQCITGEGKPPKRVVSDIEAFEDRIAVLELIAEESPETGIILAGVLAIFTTERRSCALVTRYTPISSPTVKRQIEFFFSLLDSANPSTEVPAEVLPATFTQLSTPEQNEGEMQCLVKILRSTREPGNQTGKTWSINEIRAVCASVGMDIPRITLAGWLTTHSPRKLTTEELKKLLTKLGFTEAYIADQLSTGALLTTKQKKPIEKPLSAIEKLLIKIGYTTGQILTALAKK